MTLQTDEALAEAFRHGDDEAFGRLYERYKRPLFTFALRMLGDSEAARDLVQDAFLSLYERRRQLRQPESFRSWLFAAGRNRCLSQLRRRRGDEPFDEAVFEEPTAGTTVSDVEADEEARLIRGALLEVKPEYREVLVLREYQDLSYREIAAITESTESAVKARLFKARRALHEILRPVFAARR